MSVSSETSPLIHRIAGDTAAQREIRVAAAVGALGIAVAIAGAIAFAMRAQLASFILGARIWFGVPVTDTDSLLVLGVTIQTILTVLYGLFMAAVAFGFALYRYHKGNFAG